VELDESNESLGKKIRNAKTEKLPYIVVVGDNEVDGKVVTLESRSGSEGKIPVEDLIKRLETELANRK
jgi:threonyl-tRNA synthetase